MPDTMIDEQDRKQIIEEIKQYFYEERDVDMGDFAAGFTLDFFIDLLGPKIYNKGVDDSQKYISDKLLDLDALKKFIR